MVGGVVHPEIVLYILATGPIALSDVVCTHVAHMIQLLAVVSIVTSHDTITCSGIT